MNYHVICVSTRKNGNLDASVYPSIDEMLAHIGEHDGVDPSVLYCIEVERDGNVLVHKRDAIEEFNEEYQADALEEENNNRGLRCAYLSHRVLGTTGA